MEFAQTDLLTIVIAAVINMVIGFFWFSKWLFGPMWMKLHKSPHPEKHTAMNMVYGFIASLVTAYFLAFFETYLGVTTVMDGMFVGFCLWLGFVATTQISPVIWNKGSFKLFALNTGYKLLSYLVMSGIIGA